MASSFAESLAVFMFFYPVCYGIGIGIGYFIPLMCGWEFFPLNKGTVTGIIMAAAGISSLFFGFICMSIVNPDDEEMIPQPNGSKMYSLEVASRVPLMLRVMCLCFILFVTIGILTVKRNKD